MFKIISASLLILMMSSCRTAPVVSSMPAAPQQLMMASVTNTSADAVRLVNGMTTVIDKQKVIQKLMHNTITVKDADIYETNLMRRLAGLLYIDSKIMGDIKEKIKKENLK